MLRTVCIWKHTKLKQSMTSEWNYYTTTNNFVAKFGKHWCLLLYVLLWIKTLIYVLQRRRRCLRKACFKVQPLSFEQTGICLSQDVYFSYEFVPWNDFAVRKPFKRPLKVHQHKHNNKEIYLELLIFIRKKMVWRSDEYPGNSNGNEIMWKQHKNEVCTTNKHVLQKWVWRWNSYIFNFSQFKWEKMIRRL